MFTGRTVAIGASGSSLRSEDLALCRGAGAGVIVVNECWRLAPWADLLFGADIAWWQRRGPTAAQFAGERLTQVNGEESAAEQAKTRKVAAALGLTCVVSLSRPGLCRDGTAIHQGRTSGYQAVNVAIGRGAPRVLLLGFDYRGSHWHGDHAAPLRNPTDADLAGWAKRFDGMARDLEVLGVEIVNCTAGSLVTAFPFLPLEDALGR